jgi:hypothetical protein
MAWRFGTDAYFAFFNPNTGYYDAIDLGAGVTDDQFDTDGVNVTGNYNSQTNTVTVTVVEN